MMHDKSKAIVVTSKSSFLPDEPEWRILRGHYRGDRSSGIYICIYWADGLIRELEVVQGWINTIMGSMLVSEEASFGNKSLIGWSEDECLLS